MRHQTRHYTRHYTRWRIIAVRCCAPNGAHSEAAKGAGAGAGSSAAEALHAEAAAHYFAGDHDQAEKLYQRALQADPRHLRTLCNYGAFVVEVVVARTETRLARRGGGGGKGSCDVVPASIL